MSVVNMNILNSSWLGLDFDGVDEAGKTGVNPTGNNFGYGTLCAWVTFDTTHTTNNFDIVFSAGGDDTDQATNFGQFAFGRRYASGIDNKLEILQRTDNVATVNRVRGGTTLSAGTYFLAVVSTGGAWKLYVNGVAESLTVVAGSNNGNWFDSVGTVGNRHFAVGNSWRDGAWGTGWVNGKIDEIFFYNVTNLTEAQLTLLYNGGKPIDPSILDYVDTPDVYWKMGENAGGTVTTMPVVIGNPSTDNFTMENMENADIVSTNYY